MSIVVNEYAIQMLDQHHNHITLIYLLINILMMLILICLLMDILILLKMLLNLLMKKLHTDISTKWYHGAQCEYEHKWSFSRARFAHVLVRVETEIGSHDGAIEHDAVASMEVGRGYDSLRVPRLLWQRTYADLVRSWHLLEHGAGAWKKMVVAATFRRREGWRGAAMAAGAGITFCSDLAQAWRFEDARL